MHMNYKHLIITSPSHVNSCGFDIEKESTLQRPNPTRESVALKSKNTPRTQHYRRPPHLSQLGF